MGGISYNKTRKKWYATAFSGPKRQEKYCDTRREAELWRAETLAMKNVSGIRPDYLLLELLDRYLSTLTTRSLSHQKDVEGVIRKMLSRYQLKYLRDVIPEVADKMKRDVLAEVSPSRANKHLVYLKSYMNYACKLGFLEANPLRFVDKVYVASKEKRALLEPEVYEFLEASQSYDLEMHPILLFMFNTGVRRNEALTLEWENFDFKKALVRIYDKPHIKIGGDVFRCKRESRRVIPLKRVVLDTLSKLNSNSRWVFQNSQGNHMYNNFYRRFKKILEQTSIQRQEEVSPHTTRHTWISQMLHSGVPLKTVSVMAGHRNLTTTEKYAHLVGDAESLHLQINRMPDFGKKQNKESQEVI